MKSNSLFILSVLVFIVLISAQINYFQIIPFFFIPELCEEIRRGFGVLLILNVFLVVYSFSGLTKKKRVILIFPLFVLLFIYTKKFTLKTKSVSDFSVQIASLTTSRTYEYPDAISFQHLTTTIGDKTLEIIKIKGSGELSSENLWRAYKTIRRSGALVRHRENVLIISDVSYLTFDSEPYRILDEVSQADRIKTYLFNFTEIKNFLTSSPVVFSKGVPCWTSSADTIECALE